MGYKEEALEAFTMAFDLNPDNKLAKNNMELTKNELLQQQEQTENETEESNSGHLFGMPFGKFRQFIGANGRQLRRTECR